jgi:uncharacterized membrane protein YgcG
METRLEQSQDDYRRLADELRLQREQAQLLEQRLKQQHEEQQREEWEEQQNRMEDRFGEYYSLIRGILLQQSSQEVRSKFAKGLLDNFVSKAEPKKPEEIREGVLRFVERRRQEQSEQPPRQEDGEESGMSSSGGNGGGGSNTTASNNN